MTHKAAWSFTVPTTTEQEANISQVYIAAQENARRREAVRHLHGQVGAVLHVMYSEPRWNET